MSDIMQKLKEEGYAVLNDVLSVEECGHYIELLEENCQKYSSQYAGTKTKSSHGLDNKENEQIVFNLHNKDISFVKLIDHPQVYPLIAELLREGSFNGEEPFIQILSTARSPAKDAPSQQMHSDSRIVGSPFTLFVTVLFALDDFTEESGATRVVPGSHRYKNYPETGKIYPEEIILTAPRGSVVILNGSIWHAGGVKKTDQSRWAAIFSYARWFIKPRFDLTHNTPEEIYNQLTDRQKELLGFKFNPPLDEFTRISTRSANFERPEEFYSLPLPVLGGVR